MFKITTRENFFPNWGALDTNKVFATRLQAETHLEKCLKYIKTYYSGPTIRDAISEISHFVIIPTTWQDIEQAKFDHGIYTPIRITNTLCELVGYGTYEEVFESTFPHRSLIDPALWAYTESPEKGSRDIQTPIKPGRFLKKFFPSLSETQIKYLVELEQGIIPACTLKFATTPEEIESVYTNGPSSCMSHSASYYSSPVHPTHAYASPDLAIAYLETANGAIVARILTRKNPKVYSRVYPTLGSDEKLEELDSIEKQQQARNTLEKLLAARGYTQDSGGQFDGAELRAIWRDNSSITMPYIDHYSVQQKSSRIFIARDSNATHSAGSTYGWITMDRPHTCSICGCETATKQFYASLAYTTESYACQDCSSEHLWTCDYSVTTYHNDIPRSTWTVPDGTTFTYASHHTLPASSITGQPTWPSYTLNLHLPSSTLTLSFSDLPYSDTHQGYHYTIHLENDERYLTISASPDSPPLTSSPTYSRTIYLHNTLAEELLIAAQRTTRNTPHLEIYADRIRNNETNVVTYYNNHSLQHLLTLIQPSFASQVWTDYVPEQNTRVYTIPGSSRSIYNPDYYIEPATAGMILHFLTQHPACLAVPEGHSIHLSQHNQHIRISLAQHSHHVWQQLQGFARQLERDAARATPANFNAFSTEPIYPTSISAESAFRHRVSGLLRSDRELINQAWERAARELQSAQFETPIYTIPDDGISF